MALENRLLKNKDGGNTKTRLLYCKRLVKTFREKRLQWILNSNSSWDKVSACLNLTPINIVYVQVAITSASKSANYAYFESSLAQS